MFRYYVLIWILYWFNWKYGYYLLIFSLDLKLRNNLSFWKACLNCGMNYIMCELNYINCVNIFIQYRGSLVLREQHKSNCLILLSDYRFKNRFIKILPNGDIKEGYFPIPDVFGKYTDTSGIDCFPWIDIFFKDDWGNGNSGLRWYLSDPISTLLLCSIDS